MGKLSNKVTIVTGGASGIGEAIVRAFVEEGAKVAFCDLNQQAGEHLAQELNPAGDRVVFIRADVSKEADVEQVVERAVSAFGGGLDVVVNNAAIGRIQPTEEVSLEFWQNVQATNVGGVFLMSKAAIRRMKAWGGGSIVNIGSIHGHVGFPSHAPYTASKGAVVNLTRSLALEFGKANIRVNAVCPGVIRTPLLVSGVPDEATMNQLVALHPIGRIGEPEEVAKAVVFLACEDSSFVTGSSLMVDGGFTAQ